MSYISRTKIMTWLVTGASSGLGAAICKELLNRGYNVIALARRKPLFDGNNAYSLSCDITNESAVAQAVQLGIDHFGGIDVLVNNAGVSSHYTTEESNNNDLHKIFETNFFGTCNVIRSCLPHFRAKGFGTIVNITSMHGLTPRPLGCGYCSTKHALEGLTSVLRLETQKFCRVMAVEYGWFQGTDIGKSAIKTATQFVEYKIEDKFSSLYRNFVNDIDKGIIILINIIENKKLPRHLILGCDAIAKIENEVKILKNDLQASRKHAFSCTVPRKSNTQSIDKLFLFFSRTYIQGGVLYSFFKIPFLKLSPYSDITIRKKFKNFIIFIRNNFNIIH